MCLSVGAVLASIERLHDCRLAPIRVCCFGTRRVDSLVLVEAEWKGLSGVHTALTNVLFWSHPPRLRSAPPEGRYLVGDKWRVADLNRTAEPLQFAAATRKVLHTFSSLDRLRSPARLAGVRLRFITRSEKLLGDSIASRISIAVELAAEPSFVRQLSTVCFGEVLFILLWSFGEAGTE
jgi:hypothetical protein